MSGLFALSRSRAHATTTQFHARRFGDGSPSPARRHLPTGQSLPLARELCDDVNVRVLLHRLHYAGVLLLLASGSEDTIVDDEVALVSPRRESATERSSMRVWLDQPTVVIV